MQIFVLQAAFKPLNIVITILIAQSYITLSYVQALYVCYKIRYKIFRIPIQKSVKLSRKCQFLFLRIMKIICFIYIISVIYNFIQFIRRGYIYILYNVKAKLLDKKFTAQYAAYLPIHDDL